MIEMISRFMEDGGVIAVAFLMLIENVFPPIPSEIVMPLAGFTAARGEMNLVLAIIAGWFGSLCGAFFWFWVGKKVGDARLKRWAARHGRILALSPKEIDQADKWFDKHGGKAVLIGRLVPGIRTLISVPAGISGMDIGRFLLFSSIGTAIWTTFLALAGYFLESRYEEVSAWLGPVSKVVIAGVVIAYLYKVITFRRENPKPGKN